MSLLLIRVQNYVDTTLKLFQDDLKPFVYVIYMSDALNLYTQMRPRYNGARALLRQYTWANIKYNRKYIIQMLFRK